MKRRDLDDNDTDGTMTTANTETTTNTTTTHEDSLLTTSDHTGSSAANSSSSRQHHRRRPRRRRVKFAIDPDTGEQPLCLDYERSTGPLTREEMSAVWYQPRDFKLFRHYCKRVAAATTAEYMNHFTKVFDACSEQHVDDLFELCDIARSSVRGLESVIFPGLIHAKRFVTKAVVEAQDNMPSNKSLEERAKILSATSRCLSGRARMLARVYGVGDEEVAKDAYYSMAQKEAESRREREEEKRKSRAAKASTDEMEGTKNAESKEGKITKKKRYKTRDASKKSRAKHPPGNSSEDGSKQRGQEAPASSGGGEKEKICAREKPKHEQNLQGESSSAKEDGHVSMDAATAATESSLESAAGQNGLGAVVDASEGMITTTTLPKGSDEAAAAQNKGARPPQHDDEKSAMNTGGVEGTEATMEICEEMTQQREETAQNGHHVKPPEDEPLAKMRASNDSTTTSEESSENDYAEPTTKEEDGSVSRLERQVNGINLHE